MSIILTRVRLPQRRKDLLRRVRLLDLLHRSLHRKLTFISAPPGYGKTALLLDFASDVDAAVCWYSIGADHTDAAAFAEHLIAAFQQRFPDFGRELSERLAAPGGARDAFSLAADLVNEMVARVGDFCVLMLDDFHLVGEAPAIVDFVEALLEHLPDHVRLVVAGRSVYGIPAASLYVRGDLATIGVADLRFSADELQALVRQSHRFTLTGEQAAQLAEISDGWVVALMLAARAVETGTAHFPTGAREQIYAFLAGEVLLRQPAPLQRLLLASAICDDFDETLTAHLLTGAEEPALPVPELLRELGERNLFVTTIETPHGLTYRYHQLFADFLRARLQATEPAWARALHRRAAGWHAGLGAWELAIRHALAAGDVDQAAGWMDRAAPGLFLAGRTHVIEQWMEVLTVPDRRAWAPRLVLSAVKVLADQGRLDPGVDGLLDLAEAALREEGDLEQLANVLLTRGMVRRFQGRPAEALELAHRAQDTLNSRDSYRAYQARRLAGISLGYLARPEAAVEALTAAVSGFRRLGETHDLAETLNDLGVVELDRGRILEAQRCFTEVLQIRRSQGNRRALALALNNAGYLYHQTGRYRDSWRAYEEALPSARAAKANRAAAAILNGQGDLLCDLEEWERARAAFEAARDLNEARADMEGLAYSYAGLCELERQRGRFNDAMHWLREAARCRQQSWSSPHYQAGLGAIYLEMGQWALADQALGLALQGWTGDRDAQAARALAAFRLARARHESGAPAEAVLEPLALSLRLAAELGYDQFLVLAGRRCPGLLARGAEAWPDQAQVRSISERAAAFRPGLAGLTAGEAAAAEPAAPLRLELLAFGPGRVRRDGELIANAAWASSRSRALFFFLADRARASKEEIALAFWPDFSTEKISSNFHATLWRVRRAIGREVIVFAEDSYQLSATTHLWHDVAEFEALLRAAAFPAQAGEARAEAWRQAIALYRGDYLEDIYMEWAERRRAELQRQYLRALTALAGWERGRRRFAEATSLYQRALSLDPYRDEAHAAMMECLAAAGSPAEARSHYLAYRKTLRDELGALPALPLQRLYEQLLHQT